MDGETLVLHGGEVKHLGNGRVGGYLIRFGGTDLVGDTFTAACDFGDAKSSPILFEHAMDPYIKGLKLGQVEHKVDEVGVWIEGYLERREGYEAHIGALDEQIKAGRVGWSSGTAGHLVEWKSVGDGREITRWPLGLDASLTFTPCEPRNSALPLKSLPLPAPFEVPVIVQSPPTERAQAPTTKMDENTTPTPEAAAPSVDVKALAAEMRAQEAAEKEAATKAEADFEAKAAEAGFVKPSGPVVKARFSAPQDTGAPAFTSGTPDNEANAFKAWVRSGDTGGVSHMLVNEGAQLAVEFKASNATDMNIGTAADGGYAVPTGHYNQIIARRDEARLSNKIGVRILQGEGLTMNVPIDNEDDGEFVSTGEVVAYDLDAPALGQKVFTKVKYTKEVRLSEELMDDETSGLMSFLEDFVARGMAKTHNSLLILEAIAAGTVLKATASATVIVAGELEDAVFNANLSPYLDDAGSVSWIMRSPSFGKIAQLGSTSMRWYGETAQGSIAAGAGTNGRNLLGYPVYFSQAAEAYGTTTNEFAFFGNWNYMGLYEGPSFRVLRNPYLYAATGQTALHYSFRCDYGVLQAEAIGMVEHA